MPENVYKNLLRNPFLGDWTILAQQPKRNLGTKALPNIASAIPDIAKVEIHRRASSKNNYYEVKEYAKDSTREYRTTHLGIDATDDTLCREDGNGLHISFWRRSFYDIIFALQEDDKGRPNKIWSARNPATQLLRLDFERLTGRKWNIVINIGQASARNTVEIKRLCEWPKFEEFINTNKSATPWWENGVVLLHKDKNSPHLKTMPYDILAYDNSVKSFNSIFGFRSFNFYKGESEEKDRVFATFNSALAPIFGWLFKHQEKFHRFGQPMSFEKFNDDPTTDDPDISVWAGVP